MLKFLLLLIIFICIFCSALPSEAPLRLPELPNKASLLLVPLDSRPVCGSMVQKLGKLAGFNVIVPPKELLDNYQEPADSKKLWQWLQAEAPAHSESIIATDILLHGSLLQTRQHLASEAEQADFFAQLNRLQKKLQAQGKNPAAAQAGANNNPGRLQLFSIIPRLLVSDEIYPDC